MTDASAVEPTALFERLRADEELTILDVRDRDEFEAWHVDARSVRAVQIPHVKFVAAEARGTVGDLAADLSEPVVVVCGRGEASAHVAGLLVAAGVEAANLAGGMDAWADCYVTDAVDCGAATVRQYQRPATGCLAYLIVSGEEAAVVDPLRAFSARYVADARDLGARLRYAVDTHVHADHVSGVAELAGGAVRAGNVDDEAPRVDEDDIRVDDAVRAVFPAGARERGLDVDALAAGGDGGAVDVRFLADGDELRVGDATLRAVGLPGHTTEMTGYRLDGCLFAGDSVFLRSVARPDLEAGAEGAERLARRLHETLTERLSTLPDDTTILPGHFGDAADAPAGPYAATLASLRESLPALSLDAEAFVAHAVEEMPPRPANYERILELNLGGDDAEAAEAGELELGPNNCAVSA